MKDVRFYLTYNTPKDKRKYKNNGNCIAVLTDTTSTMGNVATVGATFFTPDSDCSFGEASLAYMRENCRRVSETVARAIHPALFSYLEQMNAQEA